MPWILRLAIGSLFVFVIGAVMIACMYVHRLGNAQLVRMGFGHCRGRTHWDRSLGYAERCDSPRVAQIFSRAHECVGLPVSITLNFCQVRIMTGQPFSSSLF
jgi:hypothetical protein